jgi:hypothetical protein
MQYCAQSSVVGHIAESPSTPWGGRVRTGYRRVPWLICHATGFPAAPETPALDEEHASGVPRPSLALFRALRYRRARRRSTVAFVQLRSATGSERRARICPARGAEPAAAFAAPLLQATPTRYKAYQPPLLPLLPQRDSEARVGRAARGAILPGSGVVVRTQRNAILIVQLPTALTCTFV